MVACLGQGLSVLYYVSCRNCKRMYMDIHKLFNATCYNDTAKSQLLLIIIVGIPI